MTHVTGDQMTRPTKRPLRLMAVLSGSLLAAVATTACAPVDSFTGAQSMRWVGDTILDDSPVEVASYRAVASLPELTPAQAAKALGKDDAVQAQGTTVVGKGWSVDVKQSPFATTVRFTDMCKTRVTDSDVAIANGKDAMRALGDDPDRWAWFTVAEKAGNVRAVAEPKIEGRQTWSTGLFVAVSDEDGVCATTGILMSFQDAGGKQRLDSPYETFQEARHKKGLAIGGDYSSFNQSWTLGEKGSLVPLWQFSAKSHDVVMVDLGSGLETALDTQSTLAKGYSGAGLSKP